MSVQCSTFRKHYANDQFLEVKPAGSTDKPAVVVDSMGTTQTPEQFSINKQNILRLKRQLDLESELTSGASENENLGIEQVCDQKQKFKFDTLHQQKIYYELYRDTFQME